MNVEEMKFVKVYDCLVAKAERKGRTKDEVNQVISWLTGYKKDKFDDMCKTDSTYKDFFDNAPKMNVNRALIKGKICGIQVENIEDSFMIEVRRLDKLIDELAKGKDMSKILRVPGNIDEYISIQDEKIRPLLVQVRELIEKEIPDATEKISFAMPTWWKNHNLIHFAAMKNHLGIYPGAGGVEYFAERLTNEGYKFSKGAIQFPYKNGIPFELIAEIARWCRENNS